MSINGDVRYAPKGLVITVLFLLATLNLPLFILDLNLMIFHIGLTWRKQTTIDYIRACGAYERAFINGDLDDIQAQGKLLQKPFSRCVDWVIFRQRLKGSSKVAAK